MSKMAGSRVVGVLLLLAFLVSVSCDSPLLQTVAVERGGGVDQGVSMKTAVVEQELDHTESIGYVDRVKHSLSGFLVGVVVFFFSFVFLFLAEKESAASRHMFSRAKKACLVTIDCEKPQPELQDCMVHATGQMATQKGQRDAELGFAPADKKAVLLTRKVEVLQWVEHVEQSNDKKTYTYQLDWVEEEKDSSKFSESSAHVNPKRAKDIHTTKLTGAEVALGQFVLNANVLERLTDLEECDLSKVAVPPTYELVDGKMWMHGSNNTPGSVRVMYKMAAEGPVSLCAVQTGNTFRRFRRDVDGSTTAMLQRLEAKKSGDAQLESGAGYEAIGDAEPEPKPGCWNWLSDIFAAVFPPSVLIVRQGEKSKEQLFAEETAKMDTMAWLARLIGFVLMSIGLYCMLDPVAALLSFIPFVAPLLQHLFWVVAFLLGFLLSSLTIAVCWIAVHPEAIGSLLVLIGGAFYGHGAGWAGQQCTGGGQAAECALQIQVGTALVAVSVLPFAFCLYLVWDEWRYQSALKQYLQDQQKPGARV